MSLTLPSIAHLHHSGLTAPAQTVDLSGTWRIGCAGTQRLLRASTDDKQLVTTLEFADDDLASFKLERQPNGAYRISNFATGKYLQIDCTGDKLLSTRVANREDFQVFAFDRQSDNTFRIRVQFSRDFLHNDGKTHLVSTLNQADTPFSRFILFDSRSTYENLVVTNLANLPHLSPAIPPEGISPFDPVAPPAPPAPPSDPAAPASPMPPATTPPVVNPKNPFLPSSPFDPVPPSAPPPAGGPAIPPPPATTLADFIPESRDRPVHPSAIYGALCPPSDSESPVYTQISLDAIYGNESQFPYASGTLAIDAQGWLVYDDPQRGIHLPYTIHSPEKGLSIVTLVPVSEDAPGTQLAISFLDKKIKLNGQDATIRVLDILGVGSTDPSVNMGPPGKSDSGGHPIHPLVFSAMISASGDPVEPVLTQISLPAVFQNDDMFNYDFVKVNANHVSYREIEAEEVSYTSEELGDGVTRYNVSVNISGTITRAVVDTRTNKRIMNYSEREYEVEVLDVVGFASEKSAALLAKSAATPASPTPSSPPPPSTPPPVPGPPTNSPPDLVSPTLPAIIPVKSKIRPSESIKLLSYANIARQKQDLAPLQWSDEIAGYAHAVAEHQAAIFADEREALEFKNRFQSREGSDFPLDYAAPNPEPGFPAHSAFFYDRRPSEPDPNLPPYGIIVEIHPKDFAVPPSNTINSYPDRFQWPAESVIAPSSPAAPLTQLLWRVTRRIGCGVAEKNDYNLTVFCFDPAGNIIGHTPF